MQGETHLLFFFVWFLKEERKHSAGDLSSSGRSVPVRESAGKAGLGHSGRRNENHYGGSAGLAGSGGEERCFLRCVS